MPCKSAIAHYCGLVCMPSCLTVAPVSYILHRGSLLAITLSDLETKNYFLFTKDELLFVLVFIILLFFTSLSEKQGIRRESSFPFGLLFSSSPDNSASSSCECGEHSFFAGSKLVVVDAGGRGSQMNFSEHFI